MVGMMLVLVMGLGPGGRDVVADSAAVYLVDHGWHVGLVVAWDRAERLWPELPAFTPGRFVEVGWGDRAYYMDPSPGPATTLRAGLWPTASVVHLVAIPGDPVAFFRENEVLRLVLSAAAHTRLLKAMAASLEVDEAGRARLLGPGLYGHSRFYAGRGRYHVFNNCNHWVARMLRAAGVPLEPVMRAADLMAQLRPLATPVPAERNGRLRPERSWPAPGPGAARPVCGRSRHRRGASRGRRLRTARGPGTRLPPASRGRIGRKRRCRTRPPSRSRRLCGG
ncbi:hypothetical protein AWN76_002430 [Rhodothermaceae bacterium RA]|nr:hypothetical protein AWN76_002430 [Rhodothermaceae bacterium RA]